MVPKLVTLKLDGYFVWGIMILCTFCKLYIIFLSVLFCDQYYLIAFINHLGDYGFEILIFRFGIYFRIF